MPLPVPTPGLVIRYGYLWHSDYLAGHEEGKDRPAAIIATLRPADDPGETRVLVLPITHSPPTASTVAIEIPLRVKERLRLDDARSWVVLSGWNEFTWPGPDVCRGPLHGRFPGICWTLNRAKSGTISIKRVCIAVSKINGQ